MSKPHRVFVTGLGQVSSLGSNLDVFHQRALAGEGGARFLELDTPGLARPFGAAIPDWDAEDWLPARVVQSTAPATQFAHAAATQAFNMAGLERARRPRGGVFVGSGYGGLAAAEETYRICFTQPGARPKPSTIPAAMDNAAAGHLATEFGLRGPNLTLAVACASGTHAIGQAFRLLRAGDADLMMAGGTDAPLTPIVLASWHALRVLAPHGDAPERACRPFHRQRQGIVVGEGAGFLILETEAHARARGATLLAEVIGYGANADAGHITQPELESVSACIHLAMVSAGVAPEDVGYVNAHGTATAMNDRIESQALAAVFGEHAPRLLVSSTKGVHGHAMGASGGLEAILTVLALRDGLVPPTANLDEIDPELPALDFVTGQARKCSLDVALSNSFAFGGNNAVLAFRRV